MINELQSFETFWEYHGSTVIARMSIQALNKYANAPHVLGYVEETYKPMYESLFDCRCVTCQTRKEKGHVLVHSGPKCTIPTNPLDTFIELLNDSASDQSAKSVEVVTPVR